MGQEEILEVLKAAQEDGLDGLTIDHIWDKLVKDFNKDVSRLSVNNSLKAMLKYHEVERTQFKGDKCWREFKWMLIK